MILGGKIRSGDTNLAFVYNLKNNTYSYSKEMLSERVLQKGFESKHNQTIYMLGGDSQHTSEKTQRKNDYLNWKWEKFNPNIAVKDQLKQFAHSQENVIIPSSNEIISYSESFLPLEILHVLFGNDCEPFIAIINATKRTINMKPVPNPIRLYGYQGTTLFSPGKYFICGGLFYSRKKISKDAFIYDVATHTAKKCRKMQGMRYTMNVVAKNDKVYVIGGRSYGNDNEGIVNTCEEYDILSDSWRSIAPLNRKRCTAMSFLIEDTIYIAGGYNGNAIRETSFESYNDTSNIWNFLAVELNEPLEGSRALSYQNKLLILGGRNKLGDSNSCLLYDFTFGIDTMHLENTFRMVKKKCLHKTIQLDGHILIFGGENFTLNKFIEYIYVGKEKNPTVVIIEPKNIPYSLIELSNKLTDSFKNILKDPKLQKYSFA